VLCWRSIRLWVIVKMAMAMGVVMVAITLLGPSN
jgi:hypothetical protein